MTSSKRLVPAIAAAALAISAVPAEAKTMKTTPAFSVNESSSPSVVGILMHQSSPTRLSAISGTQAK